jgi:hypothetical protein
MSAETAHLYIIQGVIRNLPEEAQKPIEACAQELRDVLAKHPDVAAIAISLVIAEVAAK